MTHPEALTSPLSVSDKPRPSLALALMALHRFEIGPLYFFVLVWGMFIAADHPYDLWSTSALLALFINGLSLFSGFVLNAYSDYPIDRRSSIKGHIADAVERVGHRATLMLYWVEQILTVAAATVISVLLQNWSFVFVKLLGIVAGILYNGEPFRLKGRGIWNPIMLAVRLGFVPGWIAYLAVHHGVIGAGGWTVLGGMTSISFSRGIWNSISDTAEDRAEGIQTPAVLYGARFAMRMAVTILLPSCALMWLGLWIIAGPVPALIGASGICGATIYRFMLLKQASDDHAAIALLSGPIRRIDGRWAIGTYLAVVVAGAVHMINLAFGPEGAL